LEESISGKVDLSRNNKVNEETPSDEREMGKSDLNIMQIL